MPLTRENANNLLEKINRHDISGAVVGQKELWDKGTFTAPLTLDSKNVAQQLVNYSKQILDRRSYEIGVDLKGDGAITPIRVFPHKDANIESDIHDVFGRGLDAVRAVNEILDNDPNFRGTLSSGLGVSDPRKTELIELVHKFQANMQVHANNPDPEKGHANALKELKRFNGALADLLIDQKIAKDKDQASHAINFVRDFLWKRDLGNTPHCVLEGSPKTTMIRYAEPITYEKPVRYTSNGKTIDLWEPHHTQDWYRKLAKKVGGKLAKNDSSTTPEPNSWLKLFFGKHKADLQKQSSTPMSRYTPNPANAYDCTDVQVKADKVTLLSHHSRVAVTEPISAGDTASRQQMTDWNHMQLINQQRLASELGSFMEHWGEVYAESDTIPLTMLHQTLIGDEVTFSPDQTKAKRGWRSLFQGSVLDSKVEANEAVRATLNKHHILWNQDTKKVRFVPKSEHLVRGENEKLVDLKLLETNNCINMWAGRSRVRNQDINDSRKLIDKSVRLFEDVQRKKRDDNLATVIDFLKSSDHSFFTPYKFRGEKVKGAIAQLSHDIRNTDKYNDLFTSQDAKDNFALSLQSAVELKCTVHETWAGSARRAIGNFTRDYLRTPYLLGLGHLADVVIRATMGIVAFFGRGVSKLLSPAQSIKHVGERKEVYKAAYEGLLAESLGSLQGGCMSSADRAGEMAEQRSAMKRQFAEEGRIIGYNDPKEKKDTFYDTYGSTRAKHVFVRMATGTEATSDTETRGLFDRDNIMSHVAESPEEQKLASDTSGMRKGKYDDKMTHGAYLVGNPVGVSSPKKERISSEGHVSRLSTVPSPSKRDDTVPLLTEDHKEDSTKTYGH